MATKNIVPNADSEGGIGTSSKYWATGFIDAITTTGNLVIGGSIDLEGDIDVNGTTNLNIVDIDGAVNMATTALVTGVLTTTAATVFNGGFTSNAASTISTADNLDTLSLISTDADANAGPNLKFYRNSASPANADDLGFINFYGENSANEETLYGQIRVSIADSTNSSEDSRFIIQTATGGVQETSRIEITGTETIINEDSKDLDFRVESDNLTHAFFVQGSNGDVGIGNASPAYRLDVESVSDSVAGAYIQAGKSSQGEIQNTGLIVGSRTDLARGRGAIGVVSTNGPNSMDLVFMTRNAVDGTQLGTADEKMRIASGGNITAKTGNLVIGTAGKGIDFTAESTGRLGSSATDRTASVLDDYEEGTFTPVVVSGSGAISAFRGEYTKIGNVVHFRMVVTIGTNFADHRIGGLPYLIGGSGNPSSVIGGIIVFNGDGGTNPLYARLDASTSYIGLYDATDVTETITPTTTMDTLRMSGSYRV